MDAPYDRSSMIHYGPSRLHRIYRVTDLLLNSSSAPAVEPRLQHTITGAPETLCIWRHLDMISTTVSLVRVPPRSTFHVIDYIQFYATTHEGCARIVKQLGPQVSWSTDAANSCHSVDQFQGGVDLHDTAY